MTHQLLLPAPSSINHTVSLPFNQEVSIISDGSTVYLYVSEGTDVTYSSSHSLAQKEFAFGPLLSFLKQHMILNSRLFKAVRHIRKILVEGLSS